MENFWRLEKLRGLEFHRPIMSKDTMDTRMRIITRSDAEKALSIGSWGGFKHKNGEWSCKLVSRKALLAAIDETTPKDELESLIDAANSNSVVVKALDGWVGSSVTSKVKLEDVEPSSNWKNEFNWMRQVFSKAMESGIPTPAQNLRGLNYQLMNFKMKFHMLKLQLPSRFLGQENYSFLGKLSLATTHFKSGLKQKQALMKKNEDMKLHASVIHYSLIFQIWERVRVLLAWLHGGCVVTE